MGEWQPEIIIDTVVIKATIHRCGVIGSPNVRQNENTNRSAATQYFPKGIDLSVHSQAQLNKVARQLNERPRQTLQFETPAIQCLFCVDRLRRQTNNGQSGF